MLLGVVIVGSLALTNRHDSIDRLPFVVTYNPLLPPISNILREHFQILLSSKRCKEVFKHPLIVAYRRTSNLRDILVVITNNIWKPDRITVKYVETNLTPL